MSSFNAVALVSVLVSGIIAIVTLIVNYKSSNKDRQSAVQLAERARQQARLQDAYVDLLVYVGEGGVWAQTILPALGGDPADPKALHDLPVIKEQMAVRAKLAAYGSEGARVAFDAWVAALTDVRVSVRKVVLRWSQAQQPQPQKAPDDHTDYLSAWGELEDARPKEQAARKAIEKIARDELQVLPESGL